MQKLLPFRYDYLRERKNTHTHTQFRMGEERGRKIASDNDNIIHKQAFDFSSSNAYCPVSFSSVQKKPATATTSNGIYEKRTKKKQSNMKSRTNTKKRTYQAGRSTTRNTYYVLITYYSV